MTVSSDTMDEHRAALFGLCYRMTGSAADAEDMVQETFRRALERPPPDLEASLRPWLVRVATNLCIDALRRRGRETYFGPWLPAPVETARLLEGLEPGPDARYDLRESATVAFLLALEALDPRQRAVVVLRDVLGLSGPETAEALATSPGNVRVILHRARAALASYDRDRIELTEARRAAVAGTMRALFAALSSGDVDAAIALLAEDVRSLHDGGGEVIAAVRPLEGRDAVLGFYARVAELTPAPAAVEERDLNGEPGLVVRLPPREGRYAERFVYGVDLDGAGRVREIRAVMASRKLAAVRFA